MSLPSISPPSMASLITPAYNMLSGKPVPISFQVDKVIDKINEIIDAIASLPTPINIPKLPTSVDIPNMPPSLSIGSLPNQISQLSSLASSMGPAGEALSSATKGLNGAMGSLSSAVSSASGVIGQITKKPFAIPAQTLKIGSGRPIEALSSLTGGLPSGLGDFGSLASSLTEGSINIGGVTSGLTSGITSGLTSQVEGLASSVTSQAGGITSAASSAQSIVGKVSSIIPSTTV